VPEFLFYGLLRYHGVNVGVMRMDSVLEMKDICKTFYGDGIVVKANDHVNFSLNKGEIHAILGENGAGKSTLVNGLFFPPDSGHIFINGVEVSLDNPLTAIKEYKLAIARQDLSKSLIERHTVAENILSFSEGFFLSLAEIERAIKKALQKFNLGDINPKAKVWKLSGGEKQRVEILKALITNPSILILDEPTAMLTPPEIERLFSLLKNLKEEGKSIIIITHHLEEAINLSDRITVLRHGEVVGVLDTQKLRKDYANEKEAIMHLASLMVGKEVLYDLHQDKVHTGTIVVELDDAVVNNDMGDAVVHGISLHLKTNQILGLAGISGNGQRELIEGLFRWRNLEKGRIKIRGQDVTNKPIKKVRELGVAYIPEDRRKALIFDLSVRDNLMLNSYQNSKSLIIDRSRIIPETEALIRRYNIKTTSPLSPIRSLSGGNRQKVVVAREFSLKQGKDLILIAENPTFGLDVGTTQFVREELLRKRAEGAAILLVSSDLTEIMSLCDEIAVIFKGKIMGIISRENATREMIGLMMGGAHQTEVLV